MPINVAEFVAKVANPYFPFHNEAASYPSENLLKYATECAVKNKVFPLFYEGCLKHKFRLSKEADVLINTIKKRRRAQLEATKLLVDICEKYGLELMFFKTFRPYNYFPDDVDVLLRDGKSLDFLIEILKDKGYFVLMVGTPEVILRKIERDTYVDLDIHKHLAVGYVDLFDVGNLWRNHAYDIIEIGDTCKAPKLLDNYEVVREAAYSLLKDFNLSIPGLYLAINAIMKEDLDIVERIARKENLLPHLHLYLTIAYSLACRLFGSEAKMQLRYKRKGTSVVPLELCKNLKVPYLYPLPVIAWAYMSKSWLEVHRDRNLRIISQIIRQPSSKGVSIFVDSIRKRLH